MKTKVLSDTELANWTSTTPPAGYTTVSREPTIDEIRSGYGCRHYQFVRYADVVGKRFITIEGLRWTA